MSLLKIVSQYGDREVPFVENYYTLYCDKKKKKVSLLTLSRSPPSLIVGNLSSHLCKRDKKYNTLSDDDDLFMNPAPPPCRNEWQTIKSSTARVIQLPWKPNRFNWNMTSSLNKVKSIWNILLLSPNVGERGERKKKGKKKKKEEKVSESPCRVQTRGG